MKNQKINQNLIKKLSNILGNGSVTQFIKKYNNQIQSHEVQKQSNPSQQAKNETSKKYRKSKQRLLLRRKQSKTSLQQNNNRINQQAQFQRAGTCQQVGSKKLINDKAVFINVNELPYLHSTDLLNHLYKKSTNFGQQQQIYIPLYNPPLNNPYALTRVKYLHIYYCKIQSLRDIGTGWSNLVQLSVYFGKLKDLSGLNGFPSLQYLNCPFNCISTLSDLIFHPTLLAIDLQLNYISDFGEIQHLFTIQNLQYINLLGNPVYLNKQTKRKINQKFQKIIQSQNTRLQQYLHDKQRLDWQIKNLEGVEYCNNILKEFFQQSKQDQITIQSKYKFCSKNQDHNQFDMKEYQINFTTESKNDQNQPTQKTFKMDYIAPQIPDNASFEEMILKGTYQQSDIGTFCEQKIYLTPLVEMIDKEQIYLGPVLDKYLTSKLYIKDQVIRERPKLNATINAQIKEEQANSNKPKTSTHKKISKLDMTGFTNKGLSSNGFTSTTTVSVVSDIEENTQYISTLKQFDKTSTSFSTNCTNMNNTSTNFAFRRSRLSGSKSKQKSVSKASLISKINQNLTTSQLTNINSNQPHSSSLAKQSRLKLGKSLRKQTNEQFIQKPGIKVIQKNTKQEYSLEKASFSTALKRKTFLNSSKKQKSTILNKMELQG